MTYVILVGLIVLAVFMLLLLGLFASEGTEYGSFEENESSGALPGSRTVYLSVTSVIIFVLVGAIILLWGTL